MQQLHPKCIKSGLVMLPLQVFSAQGDRFRRGILLHLRSRFLLEMRLKGSRGTDVMPVLSQMILDREAEARAAL